jgi:hypothetical protein
METRSLFDRLPCFPVTSPMSAIADSSLSSEEHDWVVLVDEQCRPVRLVERAAMLCGEPFEHEVATVDLSAPLETMTRLAAARPPEHRGHPLVCCDEDGRYLGVIRIAALHGALAAQAR